MAAVAHCVLPDLAGSTSSSISDEKPTFVKKGKWVSNATTRFSGA